MVANTLVYAGMPPGMPGSHLVTRLDGIRPLASMLRGSSTFTSADALTPPAVATTVKIPADDGAVYLPDASTLPEPVPSTVQVTVESDPATRALKVTCPPTVVLAMAGSTASAALGADGFVVGTSGDPPCAAGTSATPPQPARTPAARKERRVRREMLGRLRRYAVIIGLLFSARGVFFRSGPGDSVRHAKSGACLLNR